MSRLYYFENRYYPYITDENRININKSEYFTMTDNTITGNLDELNIVGALSPEFDIFSDLPKYVFENEHANQFIMAFKKNMSNMESSFPSGISLSKLTVSEHSDDFLLLEWIFNYFRLYYGFDKNDGDFFGKVMNNPLRGEFHNEGKKMNVDDYDVVTKDSIIYAFALSQGRNVQ